MKTIRISIEEWCGLAEEGAAPPVEITLAGTSMQPLIRKDKDLITIEPVLSPEAGPLTVGDIVLFRKMDGTFVVHRVYRIEGDRVTTLGDNCEKPDVPVNRAEILGKVVRIRRGNRQLDTDSASMKRYGRICMNLLPIRKKVLHLKFVLHKNFGKADT